MTPRDLVSQHLPLVRAIAAGMKRTTLTGADMDDLISWGTLGMCEAAERFDETRGFSFTTFAYRRIQGAMVDGARLCLGPRPGGGEETAPPPEMLTEFDGRRQVFVLAAPGVDEVVENLQRDALVREAIAALPERERGLVEAVDLRGRRLEDAGADQGLSKSWASRLRKGALGMLRERLEGRVGS